MVWLVPLSKFLTSPVLRGRTTVQVSEQRLERFPYRYRVHNVANFPSAGMPTPQDSLS